MKPGIVRALLVLAICAVGVVITIGCAITLAQVVMAVGGP